MLNPKLFFMLCLAVVAPPLQKLQATELDTLTIDELMMEHVGAMGRIGYWERVESVKMDGTVERGGQKAELCVIKKRPGKIRATITITNPQDSSQSIQFVRAYDGEEAWTVTRRNMTTLSEKRMLTEIEAKSLLNDAHIEPRLLELYKNGARLTVLAPSSLAGEPMYTIQAVPLKSDETSIFYIDPNTFLPRRFSHLSGDSKTITDFSDFKEKNGLQFPHTVEITTSDSVKSTIRLHSIEIGVGIYDEYFQLN